MSALPTFENIGTGTGGHGLESDDIESLVRVRLRRPCDPERRRNGHAQHTGLYPYLGRTARK